MQIAQFRECKFVQNFAKNRLTNLPWCGIMENSARDGPPRADNQKRSLMRLPLVLCPAVPFPTACGSHGLRALPRLAHISIPRNRTPRGRRLCRFGLTDSRGSHPHLFGSWALPLLDLRGFGVFLPFDDLIIPQTRKKSRGFLKIFEGGSVRSPFEVDGTEFHKPF